MTVAYDLYFSHSIISSQHYTRSQPRPGDTRHWPSSRSHPIEYQCRQGEHTLNRSLTTHRNLWFGRGRRIISHREVSASARASDRSDFQCCGFLSRMWHSLGPFSSAFVALLMGNLQVSGPWQYYPGLHAIVACRIKVYCLVGVVFSLAQHMISWRGMYLAHCDFYVADFLLSAANHLSKWHLFANLSLLEITDQFFVAFFHWHIMSNYLSLTTFPRRYDSRKWQHTMYFRFPLSVIKFHWFLTSFIDLMSYRFGANSLKYVSPYLVKCRVFYIDSRFKFFSFISYLSSLTQLPYILSPRSAS